MSELIATKHHRRASYLAVFAYTLSLVTIAVAIYAWGGLYNWQLFNLGTYQFFPLFGLMAFSLLWSQYVVLATARLLGVDSNYLKTFFNISAVAVLLAVITHPSLLVTQLYLDDFGLPPESYKTFVGPELAWLTLLGSASLLVFLAFELRRFVLNKKKKLWAFIGYLGDLAMLAIFYHGLMLGGNLQDGWFRTVWFFYGTILVLAIIYLRLSPLLSNKKSHPVD